MGARILAIAGQRPLTTPRALERRQQLLATAAEFWAVRDYDEVSVDEIADAAGVSHGLVFQHFGSKRGLYMAGLEDLIDEFRRRTTPDPDLPPPEGLRVALGSHYDWAHEYPSGYRSLATGGGSFGEARDRMEAARWQGVARIAEGLRLDPEVPEVAIGIRAWIGYFDAAVLASLDVEGPDREAVVDLLVRALLTTAEELRRG